MSIEPKTRTIAFRLTAEEYSKFHSLCMQLGIQSFSEMARRALNMFLTRSLSAALSLEIRVTQLEERLNILTAEVRELHQPDQASATDVPRKN